MSLLPPSARRRQAGVSLIELLVGMALGLMVILAAVGALFISRNATTAVSDVSQLQQQASYALRTMGLQLRQAGSLELSALPGAADTFTFTDFTGTVVGNGGDPGTLATGSQASLTLATGQRDCVGNTPGTGAGPAVISSTFSLNGKNELVCKGISQKAGAQPLIGNVADFQLFYRVNLGTTDAPQMQRVAAADMATAQWARVTAIEVCLDMRGSEAMPDAGGTYADCRGGTPPLGQRTHLVFRNVFALRRQPIHEVAL